MFTVPKHYILLLDNGIATFASLMAFVTVSIETRRSLSRLFRRETGSCGWRPWMEKSL